jgi:hypothetical protein
MKRHLIVVYTLAIILVISGRYAWSHCEWDWVSRISAMGVILGIVIERWDVLSGKQVTVETQPTDRLSILLLCAGTFIAGFGELLGRMAFGCQ